MSDLHTGVMCRGSVGLPIHGFLFAFIGNTKCGVIRA